MSDDYERILLVKSEVFVYRIPPLGTSKGYKAADWKLDSPDFVGRLKLVLRKNIVEIKIEDKSSGELFAKCPIEKYPGPSVEAVVDSSRYFVLKIVDDSNRSAFIGIGFADRSDSFDLNVALQDHFKHAEKDEKLTIELAKEAENPKMDLGFKEGQTITINLGKKSGSSVSRPKSASGVQGGSLFNLPPPPPAGSRITVTSGSNLSKTNSNVSSSSSLGNSASPATIPKNFVTPVVSSTNPFLSNSNQPDSNVGNLLDF